jgi:CelD/BcsL family acetyltransferase involved in cellulose biosynthesis
MSECRSGIYFGLSRSPDFDCDPLEIVRRCNLTAWHFDHLPIEQRCFSPFHLSVQRSPQIDLSDGTERYFRQHRAAREVRMKARRLERDFGPLRFELHTQDRIVYDHLIAWKSDQYYRTNAPDIFRHTWVMDVLRAIWRTQEDGFRGALSALYAGDRLIAAHLGMVSGATWHYWFPTYDTTLGGRHSSGLVLILKMIEHAPSEGITQIDMGMGLGRHKDQFANTESWVTSGAVELRSMRYYRRKIERIARSFVRRLIGEQRAPSGPPGGI